MQAYELFLDPAWKAEWDAAHPEAPSPTALPDWDLERDL